MILLAILTFVLALVLELLFRIPLFFVSDADSGIPGARTFYTDAVPALISIVIMPIEVVTFTMLYFDHGIRLETADFE